MSDDLAERVVEDMDAIDEICEWATRSGNTWSVEWLLAKLGEVRAIALDARLAACDLALLVETEASFQKPNQGD